MSNPPPIESNLESFKQAIDGVKPLEQDKIRLETPRIKQKSEERHIKQSRDSDQHLHYFSDEYHPLLPDEGPMRWKQAETSPYELKKLRRGDYSPEIVLDLHGLTQKQAKREIAALMTACQQHQTHVASIMHGHGQNILKRSVPGWLTQHPLVEAFHQAPKEWGGSSALLVLVKLPQ